MTGSGKTGLAVVLLEEALLAGIPALIIDPKGDMGNLALTFPDLAPASFLPWVNASGAQAEGITVEELAEKTATSGARASPLARRASARSRSSS